MGRLRIVHNIAVSVLPPGPPAGSVDATVEQFDQFGNPSGWGPSDSPSGVFYGRTDLEQDDVWGVRAEVGGVTITPLAGGNFLWSGGPGSFEWEIWRGDVLFDSGTYIIS